MDNCANHPTHSAVEHCEICGRPLCGLCLWYAEDGRRLCESHAREQTVAGMKVLPPSTYAEALPDSLMLNDAGSTSSGTGNDIPYKGNKVDLQALIAIVVAATTLFSCFGGIYCLPFLVVGLALAALTNTSNAVNPKRTRQYAGISMAIVTVMFLCILAYVGLMVSFFVISFAASSSGP